VLGLDSRVGFQLQAIPVTPSKAAILSVEVAAVAMGEQEPDFWHREVKPDDGLRAVGWRRAGIGQVAITDRELAAETSSHTW